MKRSIDETDAPNANDARQKLKDSLIPFDQSREASEALLLQCCYSILERQPSRSLNVRGLVHELNRTVAPGAFTKRGEERTASTYVKQVLGGCRAWCEALPADVFEVVGSWSTNVELRLVSRDDADMTDDDAFVDGERRQGRVEFWDRGRGLTIHVLRAGHRANRAHVSSPEADWTFDLHTAFGREGIGHRAHHDRFSGRSPFSKSKNFF